MLCALFMPTRNTRRVVCLKVLCIQMTPMLFALLCKILRNGDSNHIYFDNIQIREPHENEQRTSKNRDYVCDKMTELWRHNSVNRKDRTITNERRWIGRSCHWTDRRDFATLMALPKRVTVRKGGPYCVASAPNNKICGNRYGAERSYVSKWYLCVLFGVLGEQEMMILMRSVMIELSFGNSPIMGREHRKFTFSRVTVHSPEYVTCTTHWMPSFP